MANPIGLFSNGNFTFIPQKLEIIVGTANIIVTEVKNFITPFKLFEIIEAYASIVPFKILKEYSLAINSKPIFIPGIGHMGKKIGLEELPEVIELILKSNFIRNINEI